MKKNNYLNDGTDSYDEEKLLYLFYLEEMEKFLSRKNGYISLLVLAIIATIIGIYLFGFTPNETAGVGISVIGIIGIIVFISLLLTNKINQQIEKLDLVYLPISQLKFQNGSILVDRSGVINSTNFNFVNLDSEDIILVNETFAGIQKQMNEMPHILSSGKTLDIKNENSDFKKEGLKLYEEEVNYIDLSSNYEESFKRTNKYTVSLKAINEYKNLLETLKTIEVERPENILEETSEKEIIENINKIDGIVNMYQDDKSTYIDIDDLCMEILQFQKNSLPKLDYTIHSSLNQVALPGTFRYTDVIEKASYNHYCPKCNEVLIKRLEDSEYFHNGDKDNRVNFPKNTLMEIVDLENNIWKCPLCETETNSPFPRHKMEDELFTLVYDKLYEENYLDRLKIYNHINDEKRKYMEKSEELFHQVLRESRTKVDQLKSKIRTTHSEVSADEMAIMDLSRLLMKYKRIAEDKAREIENDLANQKRDIENENKKSKERIDNAVDEAKNQIDTATKKYANLEREDQKKRDAVQEQIAKDTRSTRQIQEVWAERSGMNKRRGPFGILRSERQKVSSKRIKN